MFCRFNFDNRSEMLSFSGVSPNSNAFNVKALSNPNHRLGFCSSAGQYSGSYWEEVETYKEEASFYPEAVEQYASRSAGMEPGKLMEKIRRHLAFQGWKIEHNNENAGLAKFRYTSPHGKAYYSLRKVCHDLASPESESVAPVVVVEKQSTSNLVCDHNGEFQDRFVAEPKHDPEAVILWSKLMDKAGHVGDLGRAVSLRVKKHLLFHGWILFYKVKNNNIRELRYRTPPLLGSKTHTSLSSACQFLVQKGLVNVEENKVEVKANLGIVSRTQPLDSLVNGKIGANIASSGMGKRVEEIGVKVEAGKCNSEANVVGPMGKRIRDIEQLRADYGKKKKRKVQYGAGKSKLRLKEARGYQPKTMLSSLIDSNLVEDMAQVYYRSRKGDIRLKEGWVTRDGIKCMCCHEIFALTKFEAHAGSTNHRPAANIILENGRSLFELHNELKGSRTAQPRMVDSHIINSDICAVCNFGGELVLCDHCPASFHTSCIGLEEIPQGDWFCAACRCSLCSQNCSLGVSTLTCSQCERWCHAGCLGLEASSGEEWFCSNECEQIHSRLHELIGKSVTVGVDNLTWRLLKLSKSNPDDEKVREYLNSSLCLMRECFEPIKDASTGRDMVEDLIYSRKSENPKEANYQGFYTVVLEKDGELVTVANVRIYGKNVAEIPLVGTSFQHRRQGMCKILMDELEKQLREMGVERLALPAVPHVLETWTGSFGFSLMASSERLQLLQHVFLEFQGTIMCQKLLI